MPCGFAFIAAQEVIVGGDLESGDHWTSFWRSDAADEGTVTFGYADDVPAAGSGAV